MKSIYWSVDLIPDQKGRIALVTGANSGLGFQTAKALVKKNATVLLCSRSIEKAEKAAFIIRKETNSGTIDLIKLDLSDLNEVNSVSDYILTKYEKLDLLINNAGLMAPPLSYSKQGFELQFAVNHLSHMALTLKLLPLISRQKLGRVITVTSGAQYLGKINIIELYEIKKYDRWSFYSQSKLANTMFALELHERCRAFNINVASLSAHPGLARTNLQSSSVEANNSWQEGIIYRLINPLFQNSYMGALPQLFAATVPEVKSGDQYGPRYGFRGFPIISRVPRLALNINERQKLWRFSEEAIREFVDISKAQSILK